MKIEKIKPLKNSGNEDKFLKIANANFKSDIKISVTYSDNRPKVVQENQKNDEPFLQQQPIS